MRSVLRHWKLRRNENSYRDDSLDINRADTIVGRYRAPFLIFDTASKILNNLKEHLSENLCSGLQRSFFNQMMYYCETPNIVAGIQHCVRSASLISD